MAGVDEQLRANIEAQLDRLLTQLEDAEQLKDDLSADEMEQLKRETLDELRHFQDSLQRMVDGDMTLVSSLAAVQMAVRAAISEAFRTPEVIRLFAANEPAALRRRLEELDRDVKLGSLSPETAEQPVVEILTALTHLKEPLSAKERSYLRKHASGALAEFERVADDGSVVEPPRRLG